MSHEIRTPMNGILGFTSLLKEPKLEGIDQNRYIEIIENSGNRMLNIINDIINISKVESGAVELLYSDIEVKEHIEYIYTFFKPEVDKKGLKLTIHAPNKIKISCDSEKLYAILTNLVKNAIKFTDQGYIKIGYDLKEGFVRFFIKDSGIGIPDEQRTYIFERFRQGSELLTRNYEGSGLGLAISKAYVEMLGGNIWIEKNLDDSSGSVFYFTIPTQKKTVETTQKTNNMSNQKTESNTMKMKVLIAEDDDDSRLFLSIVLKNIATEIMLATNGVDAVQICKNNPDIDIVLMDIRLPILDGYSAVEKIREFNKEILIIAQTAFALSGEKEKALEIGCNDYISKPINAQELKQKIAHLFMNRES